MVLACVYHIAILVGFKYTEFLTGGAVEVGWAPLGLSFFTFQQLWLLKEVYTGEYVPAPGDSLLLYGLFFPTVTSGPILRPGIFFPQLREKGFLHPDWSDAAAGIYAICCGTIKKVLLADAFGTVVNNGWVHLEELSAPAAWLVILGYTLQLYFDFSGYSDMAIGLGRIFGFRFNENFDHPYCADSVGTFWRRWHMSLTSWFRDYLYIPLGGNRGGTARTIRNLLIVWFCTGFWHGASWNFILWGLYFAAWLILERYVLRGVLEKTPAILKHLYTLIVVFVGWGLFAMVDLGVCGDYLAACFGGAPLWSGADLFRLRSYAVTLAVLVLASTALGQRLWAKLPRQAEQLATPVLMGLSLVVCTAYLVDGSYNPFLYFRF